MIYYHVTSETLEASTEYYNNDLANRSPPVGHFYFCFLTFLVRKIPFAGIELTSQRVRGLRGTSELPGRPAASTVVHAINCDNTIVPYSLISSNVNKYSGVHLVQFSASPTTIIYYISINRELKRMIEVREFKQQED